MPDDKPEPTRQPAAPRARVIRVRAPREGKKALDFDRLVSENVKQAVHLKHYIRELIERRSLIRVLVGRQLKGSYEMNLIGFTWWLVEPLSLTLVYVVLMDFILKRSQPNYPLFLLVALLPFKWFQSSLLGAMGTVRGNASLVNDVYFPRALLPITEIMTGMAHFGVGLIVIPPLMFAYGIAPDWHVVFFPVTVAVQFLFILGLAYPMSVWGLSYRNLPGLMANLLRLWFYLSPGIWAVGDLKEPWQRTVIQLNPLTGIFQGYRGSLLTHSAPGWGLIWTAVVALLFVMFGGWYFTRREPQFGKML